MPDDPIHEMDEILQNVIRNLHSADMSVDVLMKPTFYLVGEVDADSRQEVIAVRLNSHQPCMSPLEAAGLAATQYKIEIDA